MKLLKFQFAFFLGATICVAVLFSFLFAEGILQIIFWRTAVLNCSERTIWCSAAILFIAIFAFAHKTKSIRNEIFDAEEQSDVCFDELDTSDSEVLSRLNEVLQ